MSTRLATILAGAALALAACGGSPGPASYLATGSSSVEFVQWEPTTGNAIRGTLTADTVSGAAGQQTISSQRVSFTGTVRGSSVTLTFSVLFSSSSIYGTLSGSSLTLQIPQSSGMITSGTLTQSDTSAYNAAVAALSRRIGHANQVAQAAQARAAQLQQEAQDQQTVSNDVATLQQDSGAVTGDAGTVASDIKQIASDVAQEKSDAAAGPNADGGYCYNLDSNVDYDVQSNVDYDVQSSLEYDLNSMTSDISSVRQDIQAVRVALDNVNADGVVAPVGSSSAIPAARRAIRQSITAANGYIDQANAYVTQAYAIANGIATGSCSGDGPGSPIPPVPHIG